MEKERYRFREAGGCFDPGGGGGSSALSKTMGISGDSRSRGSLPPSSLGSRVILFLKIAKCLFLLVRLTAIGNGGGN